MSKRKCVDCGKPLGSTLVKCHEHGGETYRGGRSGIDGDEAQGWQTTYNGLDWKLSLGVLPKYLSRYYEVSDEE